MTGEGETATLTTPAALDGLTNADCDIAVADEETPELVPSCCRIRIQTKGSRRHRAPWTR
jgi:hypothetical protein